MERFEVKYPSQPGSRSTSTLLFFLENHATIYTFADASFVFFLLRGGSRRGAMRPDAFTFLTVNIIAYSWGESGMVGEWRSRRDA